MLPVVLFFSTTKIYSDVLFVLCAAGIEYEHLVQSTTSVLQRAVSRFVNPLCFVVVEAVLGSDV